MGSGRTGRRPAPSQRLGALCNHSLELTGLAGDHGSPVHRLDPRAKIVGFVAITVTAVSAPIELWPVYVASAALLAVLGGVARISIGDVLKRIAWVMPLVLAAVIFLPLVTTSGRNWELGFLTIHERGLEVLGAVAAKATIGTVSAALMSMTTTFPSVLRGLEAMRVPKALVLIAGFMYRYLFVIVEEVGRLRASMSSRGYRPRTALQAGALGRAATAMFLRTYVRGERVHKAMVARGYTGTMPQLQPLVLARRDVVFASTLVGSLLAVRLVLAL